jgi:phosphoribosylformylglycinamidine cyclo-ligase
MAATQPAGLDQVDYGVLDRAKAAFISASQRTLTFARRYGFIPDARLGASANVFSLDLKPFLAAGADSLFITLLPEGLGTADDARPDDLTEAELRRFWRNIGIKTVAVLTNDAASTGMQTILIALYLPSGTPELVFDEAFLAGFLDGFVDGCRQVGCVYFSGETPQLKNKFLSGKLDIAGALFGLMPPGRRPVDGTRLQAGDRIVLVGSSGPHENGFTALRNLAARLPDGYRTRLPSGQQYWEAINAPSVLYTPLVQAVLAAGIAPTNIENITGHGWQKLMRPARPFRYVIEHVLPVPEVFQFVQESAQTPPKEMIQIFNYGAGMALFVASDAEASRVVQIAKDLGEAALLAGRVESAAEREVVVEPLGVTLGGAEFSLKKG